MNPMTMTQQMGRVPVAARRRAVPCAPNFAAADATRVANVSFDGGLWGGVYLGHATTPTIKWPARHLVARMTT